MAREHDLIHQISCAGAHIDAALSDRDVERLVQGARRRRQRRKVLRLASGCALGCAGVVSLLVFAHHRLPSSLQDELHLPTPTNAPLAVSDPTVQFSDGSTATRLDSGTEIIVVEDSDLRIGLNLVRGRGRFEVMPQPPQRSFAVRAGDVTVTVVGTAFTVERIADRVGVAVERGTVQVDWGIGSRLLHQGQSGWFPPLVVDAPGPLRPLYGGRVRRGRAVVSEAPTEAKTAPSPPANPETAGDLLLAADAARMAGHPDQGAVLLRRLLLDCRSDPRAPLAAFTLGRMLLRELGQPREAAAIFAQVRQLAPHGSFAEDALAREVEAWSQAGDQALARVRAREYLRLFPGGRRAAMVKSAGGIE